MILLKVSVLLYTYCLCCPRSSALICVQGLGPNLLNIDEPRQELIQTQNDKFLWKYLETVQTKNYLDHNMIPREKDIYFGWGSNNIYQIFLLYFLEKG